MRNEGMSVARSVGPQEKCSFDRTRRTAPFLPQVPLFTLITLHILRKSLYSRFSRSKNFPTLTLTPSATNTGSLQKNTLQLAKSRSGSSTLTAFCHSLAISEFIVDGRGFTNNIPDSARTERELKKV